MLNHSTANHIDPETLGALIDQRRAGPFLSLEKIRRRRTTSLATALGTAGRPAVRRDVLVAGLVSGDIDRIHDHLVKVGEEFGDDIEIATARANSKIQEAIEFLDAIHTADWTIKCPEIRPGLCVILHNRFVYYHDTGQSEPGIRILAMYYWSMGDVLPISRSTSATAR